MKAKFCCQANRDTYENYYALQAGSGLPIFVGGVQRGHGIGSILSGLVRSAAPVLKNIGKKVGGKLLRTGLGVASDMLDGQSFKDSARKRVSGAIKEHLASPQQSFTSEPSFKRRKIVKKKKRRADIFE